MGSHCSKMKNTIVIQPMAVTPDTLPDSLEGLDKIQAEEQSGDKKFGKGKQKYNVCDAKAKETEDRNGTKDNDDTNVTRSKPNEDPVVKQSIEYKKGPLIGRNHLAEVCECLDLAMGERLAIKTYTISEDIEALHEELELLEDEISILQDLSHENLIKYHCVEFHDVQEERGSRIEIDIIMEYASGGSLWRLIQKFSYLDERVVQNYVQQMLEGLAYLHSEGVFHGNLKGSNVLIDANGVVKLTDIHSTTRIKYFSQQIQEDGQIDFFIDSIYWTAPEVLINKKIEASADVWGVGCVMIEMLTGQAPWQSKGRHEAEKQIIAGALPPVPEDLSEICKDFLKKVFNFDPKKRPSMQELLEHPFIHNDRDNNSSMCESLQTLQTLQSGNVFRINTVLHALDNTTQNTPDVKASNHQSVFSFNQNSPRLSSTNSKGNKSPIKSRHNSMRGQPSPLRREFTKKRDLPNVVETNNEEEESSPNERVNRIRDSKELKKGWSGFTLMGVPGELPKIDSQGQNELLLRKTKSQEFEEGKADQNKQAENVEKEGPKITLANRRAFVPSKMSSFRKASEEIEKVNKKNNIRNLDNDTIEIAPVSSTKQPNQQITRALSKEEERKRIEEELMNQLMRISSKDLSQDEFGSPPKVKSEDLRKQFEEEMRRQLESVEVPDVHGHSIEQKIAAPAVEDKEDQRKKFEEEMRRQLERIDTKELDSSQSEKSFVAEKGKDQFSTPSRKARG